MEHTFISGSIDSQNQHVYKKKHKFYNSKVQAISIRGGDCATKVGALCAYFVDMGKWDQ